MHRPSSVHADNAKPADDVVSRLSCHVCQNQVSCGSLDGTSHDREAADAGIGP